MAFKISFFNANCRGLLQLEILEITHISTNFSTFFVASNHITFSFDLKLKMTLATKKNAYFYQTLAKIFNFN